MALHRVPADRHVARAANMEEAELKKLSVLSVLGVLLLAGVGAQADVVVSSSGLGWVFISQNTYGLPANLSGIGCGIENGTTCEPTGVFHFSVGFTSSGAYNIFESTGALSDQIQYFNDGSGKGVVLFYSDPNLQNVAQDATFLCTEGLEGANGCVGTFHILALDGTDITVQAASDSEIVFDPFGLGADTSDQIKFTGEGVITTVPEPGSVMLLGTGLAGLAGTIRRRLRK